MTELARKRRLKLIKALAENKPVQRYVPFRADKQPRKQRLTPFVAVDPRQILSK